MDMRCPCPLLPGNRPCSSTPYLVQIFVFFPEEVKVGVKTIKVGEKERGGCYSACTSSHGGVCGKTKGAGRTALDIGRDSQRNATCMWVLAQNVALASGLRWSMGSSPGPGPAHDSAVRDRAIKMQHTDGSRMAVP